MERVDLLSHERHEKKIYSEFKYTALHEDETCKNSPAPNKGKKYDNIIFDNIYDHSFFTNRKMAKN